jgi:hypothetical protein
VNARFRLLLCAVLGLLAAGSPGAAQERRGGVPVRIKAGPVSQCINGKTDQVWLTLYRVVMNKKSGWFTNNNQVEILIKVNVDTDPELETKRSYPLSMKVNVRDYANGQVSVPIEYAVANALQLKQDNVLYTGLGIDTTLVNVLSKNGLGSALSALSDSTGSAKVPIPKSPYTQAVGYLLGFANKAIDNDIAGKTKDDTYPMASLTLNFDPDGLCGSDVAGGMGFETTGAKAIVMDDGVEGPGFVPVNQTNTYCWSAETEPAFVLKVAPKAAGKPCGDPSYESKYAPVTNNYVAYLLQKRTMGVHVRGDKMSKDISDSLALCKALGMSDQDCPAGRP